MYMLTDRTNFNAGILTGIRWAIEGGMSTSARQLLNGHRTLDMGVERRCGVGHVSALGDALMSVAHASRLLSRT